MIRQADMWGSRALAALLFTVATALAVVTLAFGALAGGAAFLGNAALDQSERLSRRGWLAP